MHLLHNQSYALQPPGGGSGGNRMNVNSPYRLAANGNNIFLLASGPVGTGTTSGAYSTNQGQSWTATTIPNSFVYGAQGIAFGNGRFVVIGFSGTAGTAAYSANGASWGITTLPGTSLRYGPVAYGAGLFVTTATGISGALNGSYATSPDGITWTGAGGMGSYSYPFLCFANGKFVALGVNSAGTVYVATTSTNGLTWTTPVAISGGVYGNITGGNGYFVSTGNANIPYYSTNGTTWTSSSSISGSPTNVAYGAGRFVITPSSGRTIWYTDNPSVGWTATNLPTAVSNTVDWNAIAYGTTASSFSPGWITAGQSSLSYVSASSDGATWY